MSADGSVGLLYDRIRWEEKEIARQLEARGTRAQFIDSKLMTFGLDGVPAALPPVVIERCVSFYRGMNVAEILEQKGAEVVNSSRTLGICGNKLSTSLVLSKNGIPTPKTIAAFSAESAMDAVESIGYPCVMKPIVGSWGRQVVPIRDRETAEAFIGFREQQQGDSIQSIFYVQEMVERPPRDVRCITAGSEVVACVYRYAPADSWKTNVALGGRTEPCSLTSDLEKIVLRASESVGGGVLGIDVMEDKKTGGFVVHEVNGTVEFKGAQAATKESIAGKIAEYANRILKRSVDVEPGYERVRPAA